MVRILILLLALGSGGVAAWMALSASETPAAASVAEKPLTPLNEVLVAGADIGRGASLTAEAVRWQPWPAEAVPPGFISRSSRPDAIESLKGSMVRSAFVAGEPIRDEKLAQPDSGFLSVLLPSGKRAIAVRVTAESTAGGFILPDDRVDVIHTVAQPDANGGSGAVSSRAILKNVRVLAVDQSASQNADGTAVVGKTATLEVDPEHVAIIAEAEASGSVSLALRAAADSEGGPSAPEGNRQGLVRVIRGGRAELVEVRPSSAVGS